MKRSVYFSFILVLFICAELNAQRDERFPKQYRAAHYNGPLAAPDFESNPKAKMFKTRINEQMPYGINFAGHYTIVEFGCGTSCQSLFVVDRKTGIIYDGMTTELGMAFNNGNRLFIKNHGAAELTAEERANCSYCKITYWEWKDNAFVEIKKE